MNIFQGFKKSVTVNFQNFHSLLFALSLSFFFKKMHIFPSASYHFPICFIYIYPFLLILFYKTNSLTFVFSNKSIFFPNYICYSISRVFHMLNILHSYVADLLFIHLNLTIFHSLLTVCNIFAFLPSSFCSNIYHALYIYIFGHNNKKFQKKRLSFQKFPV